MAMDYKPVIKSEPIDIPYGEENKTAPMDQPVQSGLDDEVAAEFNVVLLQPNENSNISRLLFSHRQTQNMSSCTARLKKEVKHLELNYQTPSNNRGESTDETAALYDGSYNGENVEKNEELLRHVIGFFRGDRFYMVPLKDSYEMHRKIVKRNKDDSANTNKINDLDLFDTDATPSANPVRLAFARQETEWQKKRREQSAQYKQQVIDNDPWITLDVHKSSAKNAFEDQVKKAEQRKPATINKEHKLPVL